VPATDRPVAPHDAEAQWWFCQTVPALRTARGFWHSESVRLFDDALRKALRGEVIGEAAAKRLGWLAGGTLGLSD
jgi:hypothetical protein